MLDGAPYQRMIEQIVAVDQNVPKSDDRAGIGDARGSQRVMLRQAFDGLADDLEIALDGLAQQAITLVVRQTAILRHLTNEGSRIDVLKQFCRPGQHTQAGASD